MKSIKKTLKFLGITIGLLLFAYIFMWVYAVYVASDSRLYCDDFTKACLKCTFGTLPKDSKPYASYTNYMAQVDAAWKKL